ncbi:MAG: AmmeMemoRadiSam system protein B [Gallionella sp.]|nr:AmmeMemoRadiSam system protein B [Gallionella sp.]
MQNIRAAAVAGLFYPGEADVLMHDVRAMLAAARPSELSPNGHGKHAAPDNENRHARFPHLNPLPLAGEEAIESLREFHVKALIVPHAGYIYSGAIAASAYASLKNIASKIHRVVLLGPTHRVAVHGLALPGTDTFTTPLGNVRIDLAAAQAIAHLPQVTISAPAHAQEHSLEVQLPFLQSVLPDFKLLPLAVGMASAEEVAEVLEVLWGGDETLIVISSDLSHYLPYPTAQRVDNETVQSILKLHQPIAHDRACGGTPISGLIVAAKKHSLTPHLLDLRNSGDTAGSHDQVVGYAAIAFTQDGAESQTEHQEHGRILLQLARNAIAEQFGRAKQNIPQADWLKQPGATFVTLTLHGQLRGCIGSLEAHRPLAEDVRRNAVASAFQDPRFAPLTAEEFADVAVEVSLLTPAQPMQFRDELDALTQLRPNVDGVIFEYGAYRSTFLPQVWENLAQPRQFLAMLKRKAGLPDDFWAEGIKLSRYTVEKWSEKKQ